MNSAVPPTARLARSAAPPIAQWPTIAVYAALPTVGLVAGPSYAALIFGLGLVQLLAALALHRRFPAVDLHLTLIATAFAALCWASVTWSIDPTHSRGAALQTTAIFAGAVIFLAATSPPTDRATDLLFRALLIATILGAAIVTIDWVAGDRFESLVTGRPAFGVGTKYNRGVDYLVLIAWPQFGFLASRRRWWQIAVLAICIAALLAVSLSLAAQAAALAGLVVLVLAFWLPRITRYGLATGMILLAGGIPFWLRLLTNNRATLAHYLKNSGLDRLEIWDYMTARVLECPLLGWGIANADAVPITNAELSHYVVHHSHGIYPHNQWLELWVETGALGALIGLAFALLVLWRINRLAAAIRPFAYAAYASAVTVSCVNFEVTTDSWWAALAASAWLLMAACHRTAAR